MVVYLLHVFLCLWYVFCTIYRKPNKYLTATQKSKNQAICRKITAYLPPISTAKLQDNKKTVYFNRFFYLLATANNNTNNNHQPNGNTIASIIDASKCNIFDITHRLFANILTCFFRPILTRQHIFAICTIRVITLNG